MEAAANMRGGAPEVITKKRGISGSTIKIIAVAAMLIDHIGAVVLIRQIIARNYSMAYWGGESSLAAWMAQNGVLFNTYEIMRGIGRLGFPIFCFLLAEGFQRTRNVGKYALRLGIFALISEIPFNLALAGEITAPGYQNVYFTLLLGLLALCGFRFFEKRGRREKGKGLPVVLWTFFLITGVLFPGIYFGIWLGIRFFSGGSGNILNYLSWSKSLPVQYGILCAVLCLALISILFILGRKKGIEWIRIVCADMTALVVIMYAAELLYTDYAGMGVLTIAVIYVLRKNPKAAIAAGCAVLTLMSLNEIFAFVTVVFVALYNGERGLKMKYFFYAFYPVHLFVLYLIVLWMGLGNIRVL